MGSGSWDASTYTTSSAMRATKGVSDFAYSDTTRSAPRSTWKVNEDLAPTRENKKGLHAGKTIRESLDNDEHPTSLAIAVLFDVTGSMHLVPQLLLKKLPELWGMLLRKGYVEHPQVLFGGIGDAYSDRVPLQVGQFESDNRSDDDLGKIFLEGGGGGGAHESYELAMYFMANYTYLDCVEKRGHKGYLFMIGDEMPYGSADRHQIGEFIGDTPQSNIPTEDIVKALQQKYEVFLIRPKGGSYLPGTSSGDEVINTWKKLLGQNVIDLDDDSAVCEAIAVQIGLAEGVLGDLEEGLRDLKDVGADDDAVAAVGKALATVTAAGGIAVSDAPTDIASGDDGIERL